ncbi:MAG TPA: hypothetical protein VM008_14090 [Phycisphaerae bacterium]|nr:hypothetical protein [Phycisphaerae bacterium]
MKKTISLALLAIFGTMAMGCSETKTVSDNSVAAQMSRSLPTGAIAGNSAAVNTSIAQAQNANGNTQVASILNGLAAMNQVAAKKAETPGVPSSLTINDLINAFNQAQANTAAKASQPRIGPGQGVVGPGPLFQPTGNGQQLKNQYVPAMASPY